MDAYSAERHAYRTAIQARIPPDVMDDDTRLIAWLRNEGCHILDSIVIVRSVRGISLGAAKDRVSNSPAWEDRRAAHDAIHDIIEQALDQDPDY